MDPCSFVDRFWDIFAVLLWVLLVVLDVLVVVVVVLDLVTHAIAITHH